MRESNLNKALLAVAFAFLYVVILKLTYRTGVYQLLDFDPWLFFPPAFLRLAAFLVLGFWSIPALFLAGLFVVDFGLNTFGIIIVSACCAVGGPFGVDVASKLVSLKSDLSNLTPLRLLALSLGCALGNAALLKMGLLAADYQPSLLYASIADPEGPHYTSIVIGDTVGTWVMIYLIKSALTIYGRSLKH